MRGTAYDRTLPMKERSKNASALVRRDTQLKPHRCPHPTHCKGRRQSSVGEGGRKMGAFVHSLLGEMQNSTEALENNLTIPQKLKSILTL